MRFRAAAIGLLAVVGSSVLLAQSIRFMSLDTTHRLGAACTWNPRPWLKASEPFIMFGGDISRGVGLEPGGPHITTANRNAERACLHRRGWFDPDLKVILDHWPTPEERAGWALEGAEHVDVREE